MILIIERAVGEQLTLRKFFWKVCQMIVCVCTNISDRELRQAVDLGLSSMAELRRDLGVATCCGKCASCARQVLNAHLDSKIQVTELSFRSAQAA